MRISRRCLPAWILSALLLSPASLAAPESSSAEDFCAWAQSVIAGTSLRPAVQVHTGREAFIESKALDQPFTVQQFSDVPLSPDSPLPTVISCKMRTTERINHHHATTGGEPAAGPETSCDEVHRRMLGATLERVPALEQRVSAQQWVIEEEELTFIGPKWLEPWPFVPVARGQGERLHLRTRALYVPHAWWIPMPERFLGNYYCHLVSPRYLEALVRGDAEPD